MRWIGGNLLKLVKNVVDVVYKDTTDAIVHYSLIRAVVNVMVYM